MKKTILLAALFFQSSFCFSQFHVKGDSDFKYLSKSFNHFAQIDEPNFDSIDFEMRFYARKLSSWPHSVYIINHFKNNRWNIIRYKFCSVDWLKFENFKKDTLPDTGWNKTWDSLQKEKILTLSTEDKVIKKWKASSGLIPIIADGVFYRFELLTKSGKRRFGYSNPETKLKDYDLNNKELVRINHIISVLNNIFGFKK